MAILGCSGSCRRTAFPLRGIGSEPLRYALFGSNRLQYPGRYVVRRLPAVNEAPPPAN